VPKRPVFAALNGVTAHALVGIASPFTGTGMVNARLTSRRSAAPAPACSPALSSASPVPLRSAT